MNDTDLVNQIRKGNNNAFGYLIENYQGLVWHMVLRMSGNTSIAEDLYQEVFYRVYKNINTFKGNSKLSTWIGSIAYNVTSDYLRKKKNIRLFEEKSVEENKSGVWFAANFACPTAAQSHCANSRQLVAMRGRKHL